MSPIAANPSHRDWGPRPTPALGDAVTRLSKARVGVLDLLAAQGRAVTVADVARLSGQHHNTVREHLEALAAAGLAQSRTRPAQGRGRPALLYTAVPVEQSRPQVRAYSRLAAALAAHIARTSGNPMDDARGVGRVLGAELIDEARAADGEYAETTAAPAVSRAALTGAPGGPPTRAAAREIVGVLHTLGYDPHRRGGTVMLRQCPVLEVARQHPDIVCQVHLGVVDGMYAAATGAIPDGVVLEPFADPTGCRLRLPGLVGSPAADPATTTVADPATTTVADPATTVADTATGTAPDAR